MAFLAMQTLYYSHVQSGGHDLNDVVGSVDASTGFLSLSSSSSTAYASWASWIGWIEQAAHGQASSRVFSVGHGESPILAPFDEHLHFARVEENL